MSVEYVLGIGLTFIQYLLLFFWVYWLFISLFGFGKPKRQEDHAPYKRFIIMVPAHNEEAVIGNLVENLHKMDYPKELYEVCVIADGCSDRTGDIARKLGATVIEHTYLPGERKGKPYGIKYAIEQYGDRMDNDFDGIAFFDADNLVSLNYLKEMNNHLLNGDKLIQCYLDSKNPNDNWVTMGYSVSYIFMNRSWQLAKSRLGLGNAIGGTGFCVDTALFRKIGWTARSLTEDLEFTIQCLLEGVPAKWCHFARVYDEKPESFKSSCIQRLRWARGHWDVCFKYSHRLIWRFISKLDVKAFDGFMYLINPGKIVLSAMTGILVLVSIATNLSDMHPLIPWQVWMSCLLFQFVYVGYAQLLDSNHKVSIFRSYVYLYFFNFTYVPLFIWSLITMKNVNWNPTKHTRAIHLNDIELEEKNKAT
ncbi:glycosyltransferase family 2 protein [Paenibacillus assamensis]|uniref:glycosyltransferase family 2 protein n=1 Tax=Paenibacillus assamensis TaxID=311244 RepID=UPI00040ADA57|nr:glycosyltransferase family 2 protein [Paenibacillus assamensis]